MGANFTLRALNLLAVKSWQGIQGLQTARRWKRMNESQRIKILRSVVMGLYRLAILGAVQLPLSIRNNRISIDFAMDVHPPICMYEKKIGLISMPMMLHVMLFLLTVTTLVRTLPSHISEYC